MALSNEFGGVVCPMVTPFDDRFRVDEQAVSDLVEFLIARGIAGLMIAGSTGEGPLLSLDERQRLVELVVSVVAGRCLTMAHVGCMSTQDTVLLTEHAVSHGADAVSAIVPYFFTYDETSLSHHFEVVMRSAGDVPCFIYSFPGNAKNDVSPSLVRSLREIAPNFAGLKVSGSDLGKVQEFMVAGGDGFAILTGADGLMLPALAIGASGSVSGNANVFPELFCGLYDAFRAGDWARAQTLQRHINTVRAVLRDGLHPAFFKAALSRRGIRGGKVRSPMRELSASERSELDLALDRLESNLPL